MKKGSLHIFQQHAAESSATITFFLNCSSTHVVYTLKCPCSLIYVGHSFNDLHFWTPNYRKRTQTMDYVIAQHYANANHGFAASPSPTGGDSLLHREAYWARTLKTVEPFGLNEELNLSCFLNWLQLMDAVHALFALYLCNFRIQYICVLLWICIAHGVWHLDIGYDNSHPWIPFIWNPVQPVIQWQLYICSRLTTCAICDYVLASCLCPFWLWWRQ